MIEEELKEKEEELKKDSGEFIENEYTLKELIDFWFENYKHTKFDAKGSTISTHSYTIDNLEKEYMPEDIYMIAHEMTFEDIQQFYDQMLYVKKLSYSYVKKFRVVIRGAITHGFKNGWLRNTHAIDYSKIPKPTKTKEQLERNLIPRYLEKEEAQQVISVCSELNRDYADVYEMQYLTGARVSEILALEDEVDIEDEYLWIRGTYDNATRSPTRGQKVLPKTNESFRILKMNKRTIELIKERRYRNQFIHGEKSKFLFVTSNDKPYSVSELNKFLYRHHDKFELKKKDTISTHVFRHIHISRLAELNVPLRTIMDRVGHRDRDITEKIYTHITNKMKQDLSEKLEQF